MTIRSDYPLSGPADPAFDVVELESGVGASRATLHHHVGLIGRYLRRTHGLRRGDVVVVVGRAGLSTVRILLALLAEGIVAVPTNPAYLERELAHVFADSGARLVVETADESARSIAVIAAADAVGVRVVGSDDVIAAALTAEDLGNDDSSDDSDDNSDDAHDGDHDDDVAMLIYTSGTTGRSKGCAHTHRDLRAGIGALMRQWEIGPDDVVINPLPLFHVHGLCVCLLGALWHGARVILVDRFTPAAIVDAVHAGGTVLMTVPTMIHRLLGHFDDTTRGADDAAVIGRLRLVTCGSAALSAASLVAFRERTGLTILERYGMSETLITLSNPLHGERVAGAVGRPVPGTTIRVVDDELQLRTPGMMRGYWNQAGRHPADDEVFVEADADDVDQRPWFRTGDAVSVDDDGVVRIVGRMSQDILKVGGFKLSTREIEEAVATHDDVAEVAVIGLPDDEWGERVCACVVVRAGRTLTLEALQAHVQLAAAKKPRALLVVDALPRNALGKVTKPALKDLAKHRGV